MTYVPTYLIWNKRTVIKKPNKNSNSIFTRIQLKQNKIQFVSNWSKMDWTKMSSDKIRSKRTYVQCDDRRPDQTTIYDQESIKYRPPPFLLFGLDQKYNGQLIVQTIVKPMISVLPGHSKSIIGNSKLNPKSKQQNVQRLTLFIKRVLQKFLKLLSLAKLLQDLQQEFEILGFF